ncbi:hypothetical protein ACJW30_11G004400 [Castanea mollissima]
MSSSVSISLVILVWITTIIIINHVGSANTSTVAKPQSPPLAQEAKALNQTQWWWWRNEENPNHCKWDGIICNDGGSVIEINLDYNPYPSNFNFNFSSFPNLVRFNLSGKGLDGSIPPEIGSVSKLTYLNLSWNSLSGELPLSLTKLTQLEKLDISFNQMSGPIPLLLGNLSSLVELYLGGNCFSGTIPSTLGLLTCLTHLDLHSNQIGGTIPSEIYNLKNLTDLNLSANNLLSPISSKIGKLKNLVSLDLSYNTFTGPLLRNLSCLKNLTHLFLCSNKINSPIPLEIGEMRELRHLDLHDSSLSGSIPSTLGLLTYLTHLDLQLNQINGAITSTLGLLTCLTHLDLHSNQINGTIPSEIYNLKNLMALHLGTNSLFGPISSKIGKLKNLVFLDLSNNMFTGPLLYELSRLTRLQYLNLSSNKLSGRISTNLENLVHLSVFDLSLNKLRGPLPTQLMNLHALEQLLLSHNNLTGSIPRVAYPFNLTTIDLSHNLLSGEIPPLLGKSKFLQYLDLSNNNFTGNIPPNLVFRHQMNLSYNSLTGPLPEDFDFVFGPETIMGNKDLCCEKDISGFRYCYGSPHITIGSTSTKNVTKWIKIIPPIVISFIFLLLGIVLLSRQKIIENTHSECEAKRNGDILSIWNYDGNIAFEDIITATEDFDIKYCIGTGGYGSVYKAMLPSGKVIALKKLHRLESQEPAFDKSFRNEAKVLSEVRHRNIVKLYGYCLHNRCMFLVYEYMEKGSLFYAISNDVEAKELDWKKRVNIIKGIANALSYLHHDCIPTIIHRDLTTSNILLNSKLEAFVADFGIARPLNPDSSNLTTLAGTCGYIAPVVLETTMGRHPGELISSLASSSTQHIMLKDVLDPRLSPHINQTIAQNVVLVVTLALACLRSNPKSRPTMKHVSQEFLVRKPPLPKSFYEISMWELMNQEIYLVDKN